MDYYIVFDDDMVEPERECLACGVEGCECDSDCLNCGAKIDSLGSHTCTSWD